MEKTKIMKFLIRKLKYASEDSIYKFKNKEEYFIYYHPILDNTSYSINLSLRKNMKYTLSLFKQNIDSLNSPLFFFDEFDDKTLNELNRIYSSLKYKINSSEEKHRKTLEDFLSKHNL